MTDHRAREAQPSESGESAIPLRRRLRRFDVVFFLACGVINLDTLGSVAANGAQGFTWLAFLGVAFVVPYGLVIAELGSAFPQEGGQFVWVREAWGGMVGAINSVVYWISNPIWLGGSLTIAAVAVFEEFFLPLPGIYHYLFGLVFISLAVLVAVVSIEVGKWIPTVGTWVRIVLFAFFTVSVVIYAVEHGVHGFGVADFSPTTSVFLAIVPVLLFNYVGLELANAAGGEIRNPQRDIPRAILSAGGMTLALYALPVLSVLVVLPSSEVTSLGGFIDAMKAVFTVYGGEVTSHGATLSGAGRVLGDLAAVGFIVGVFTSGVAWIMGGDRVVAISCLGGGGPRWLGKISERHGTPVRMNLLSGVVAVVFMIMVFTLTSGNTAKYFTAALGLAISTTTITYCVILPTVIRLRYKRPELPRPFRVPGGKFGLWFFGLISTGWVAFATVVLLWPGLGTSNPDSALPTSFAHQRLQYELAELVPLGVILALGIVFHLIGRRSGSPKVTLEPVVVSPSAVEAEGAS